MLGGPFPSGGYDMNDATLAGMRNLWTAANTPERTMTPREMALTSWGRVHQDANVEPDGTRWAFDKRRNLFVAY
jgi:hypothetical protein